MKIAINGLGRIGRHLFRLACKEDLDIVFINEPFATAQQIKLLIQHDTVYGNLLNELQIKEDQLILPNKKIIKIFNEKDINTLDVNQLDILIESSGRISSPILRELIKKNEKLHIIITCNPKEEIDQKIIYGTNQEHYDKNSRIISTMTCDVTAISPVLKRLLGFGINSVSIISMHPYLSNQHVLDNSPREFNPNADLSLWRSAIDNLIPKQTSAAEACMQILPELAGKIISFQLRVPTSCVSAAFMDFELNKEVTKEQILDALNASAKGIIQINDEPLVSKDFANNSNSAIVDMARFIVDGNKLKILIWYDNEVGYSSRVLDVIKLIEGI
ncbi:MAG: glyceraldehyde 3-phosphate dehydrogenase NAD-binding domain-containing protein [bacterium]